METTALETMIKALTKYQESLVLNERILRNAASVCTATMGNDSISKKHIQKLEIALEELKKVSSIAEEVTAALIKEKADAEEIVRRAGE